MFAIVALGSCLGCIVYVCFSELNLYDPGRLATHRSRSASFLGGLSLAFLIFIGVLHLLEPRERTFAWMDAAVVCGERWHCLWRSRRSCEICAVFKSNAPDA